MYRKQARDLVEILHWRGEHQHGRSALTFSADDGAETTWTYGELDVRARSFAVALRAVAAFGDRAVLLCPGGLQYVRAIAGCFYAGVVAVPAYPPANARQLSRIDAILRDCGSDLIVTTTETRDRINKWLAAEKREARFRFICVDEISVEDADRWSMPALKPETLAFLQYTSGSTSDPKGVMVGHGNLMANLSMIEQGFALTPDHEWGTWLPVFHDMGLIGNLLEPLYLGAKAVMMSPQAFVREPVRWLQLLTRHRSSVTGAPNFGYALCARGVSEEQKQELDLSALTIAYCGSEPIDPHVLERFADAFRDCGFRKEAFFPCYGMAEATLFATGSTPGAGARYLRVDARALESDVARPVDAHGPARLLTACGHPAPGQELRIVDPETRRRLEPGRVGEVWLKGPNIAQGYWGNDTLTRETFGATLDIAVDEDAGPYLRTGDLAFIDGGGNLFVTGRSKDLIIIRGRNFYPQDLERTAAESSAAVQPGGTAAFAIEIDGSEELVVVQEIRRAARHDSGEELVAAIRNAIASEYELAPYAIVLLKPATLPKTSSGKVRRAATRQAYLDETLDVHYAWTRPRATNGDIEGSAARADEAIAWFRHYAETRIDSRLVDERRTIPPYVVLDLGNHGFFGLQAPLDAGGLALTYRDAFRVLVQLAAFDLTIASLVGVHNALGLRPLLRFGSERQKQELLPNLAAGRELASFAYTEPAAGSNFGAIESTATPDGRGGWLLRGSKKWIGSAAWSGTMHVFAHLLDDDGRRLGITGFTVRQGAEGLLQGPEELTMGSRGMVQNAIELHDVRVGPEDLLGAPGEGAAVAQDVMQLGRICIAVSAAGVLKRAAQLMTRYARQRTIATGRLLDNAVTRERLTQIATEAAALDAFIGAFAEWLDAGIEVPKECFAAIKALASESAFVAADHLMQLLGGRGYIETNLAAPMVRDVRLLRIFEGPTETMQMFVGTRVAAGSAAFSAFLRERLGASDLATQLEHAARELKARAAHAPAGDDDGWRDGQRVAMLLGDLAMHALWLAVVERAQSHDLERARTWLRGRFARALAAALEAEPQTDRILGSRELERIVAGYTSDIGDLEQYRPGVLHDVDPLLRRESTLPPPREAKIPVKREAPRATSVGGNQRDAVIRSLRQWIAQRLGQPAAAIGVSTPFADMGLDSVTAVELTHHLEQSLGITVAATATWDFPNILTLAEYVAGATNENAAPPPADPLDGLSESELAALLESELNAR